MARPRYSQQLLAERCVPLRAFTLPKRGRAKIVVNAELAKKEGFPKGIGIRCFPNCLCVVFGGQPPHGQRIERQRRTHRYTVRCPHCGIWTRVLYLPPQGHRFLCSVCAGITAWRSETIPRSQRPPKPELELLAMLQAGGAEELADMLEATIQSEKTLKQLQAALQKGDKAGFERGIHELAVWTIALIGKAASQGNTDALRLREELAGLLYPGEEISYSKNPTPQGVSEG